MRLRFASTALDGQTVTLTAARGGTTAGPLTSGVWTSYGQVSTGGPIAIQTDRSTLQCAPDSVRFSANLDASTFSTPGPGSGEHYDARLHDLVFLWDFGDAGTWLAPENVLPSWRNKRYAKGPWVSHVYTEPGTYTVKLTVIEPATGKVSHAPDRQILVQDPDTVYPGTQTIAVNPLGDGDFSWAPAGAVRLNLATITESTPEWITYNHAGLKKRWLFKDDSTFTVDLDFGNSDREHAYLGRGGGGTNRPIFDAPDGTRCFDVGNQYRGFRGSALDDFRIVGIDMRGTYDPTSEGPDTSAAASSAVWCIKYLDMVISDCRVSGFRGSSIIWQAQDNQSSHIHIDDTVVTDFGGQYAVFGSKDQGATSSYCITGCRIAQNPDAADFGNAVAAPVRLNNYSYTYIAGCDVFGYDRDNAAMRLNDTPEVEGNLVNVHSCATEGGLYPVCNALNASQGLARCSEHNAIFDGLVVVGYYRTQQFFYSCASGMTIRNVLGIQPNVPVYINPLNQALAMVEKGSAPPQRVFDAPIRLYNNTWVMARSQATNNNVRPATITPASFTNTVSENNILDGPWAEQSGNDSPHGPFVGQVLWERRNRGQRDPVTFVLDASYATPIDAVRDFRPVSLTAVQDGLTAHSDLSNGERPDPPAIGAWDQVTT